MPQEIQVTNVNNENWTSFRKLWTKLKIIRQLWKVETDIERKNYLKSWEIETARKLVEIAKTLTDGKGNPIPVPMFPILGSNQ